MALIKLKIKKGDLVKVLVGKEKGKQAKVLRVIPKERKVVLEGLFLVRKHIKPSHQQKKGEVVQVPRAVPVANVALICPHCSQATRVGNKISGDQKVRICKKCQSIV